MVEIIGEPADHRLLGAQRDRAAMQRPQARHQLLHGKRLDQIVVGACVEPGDPVVEAAECRQHQHRRIDTQGAQLGNEVEAFAIRHAAVEHDGIVRSELGRSLGIGKRGNVIDDDVAACQRRFEHRGHLRLVLKQQNAHARNPSINPRA
jgi:hypothetical protein